MSCEMDIKYDKGRRLVGIAYGEKSMETFGWEETPAF